MLKKEHRFTTLEVPEAVASHVGAPFTKAVAMAERGLEQRAEQARVRAAVDAGLAAGDKFDVIALAAGCSKSLVQKRAKAQGIDRGRVRHRATVPAAG